MGTSGSRTSGQDLYQSGLKFGARIVELVGEGDVLLFIATPGQLNIQPRVDGALDAIKDSGKPIRAHVVATGADVGKERTKIEATYLRRRRLRGMFAVDGGSTQGVAEVMRKYGLHKHGVRAGGYDLLPGTLEAIAAATSTSRSTSSPTSRASCRSCSSSSSSTAAASSRPPTRTPASSSSHGGTSSATSPRRRATRAAHASASTPSPNEKDHLN